MAAIASLFADFPADVATQVVAILPIFLPLLYVVVGLGVAIALYQGFRG
jgi:hypothetical protein